MRRRSGIALFAALSFLVLLGLLLSAAVASTLIASRSARLAELDASLITTTDYALGAVLANPDSFGLAALPYGSVATFDVPIAGAPPRQATVRATRLAGNIIWLVAEATSVGGDRGTRRVNALLRFRTVGPLPVAPIVTRTPPALGADVHFDIDSAGDADCAVHALASPAAISSDTTRYFLTAPQLARLDSAGRVRHVHGDTTIGPGTFQGILVADGSLAIVGPMSVVGLIVARGPVSAPSGLTLSGAMLSFDSSAANSVVLDHATVRYSPCDVARELRRATSPQRVRVRGWAELM